MSAYEVANVEEEVLKVFRLDAVPIASCDVVNQIREPNVA